MVWTEFGILKTPQNVNTAGIQFLLTSKLTESNNPIVTGTDCVLRRIQNANINRYSMKFRTSNNETELPKQWINSTIISLAESIHCKLKAILEDGFESECKFLKNETKEKINEDEIQLRPSTWFNVDYYSARRVGCTIDYVMNGSLIETKQHILHSPVHHLSLMNSKHRMIPVIQIDSQHLNLTSSSPALQPGSGEICFYDKFKSFGELISQKGSPCPLSFKVEGLMEDLIYLDVNDSLNFTVRISLIHGVPTHADLVYEPWLRVEFSDPKILSMRSKRVKKKRSEEIIVLIQQTWSHSTLNTLSISPTIYHGECGFQTKSFQILNSCPPGKKLLFEYPKSITPEKLLLPDLSDSDGIIRVFNLPVNYQPPSSQGVGIPQTVNVYNADPSSPMLYDQYLDDQTRPVYKQCKGMKNRYIFIISSPCVRNVRKAYVWIIGYQFIFTVIRCS